MGFAHPVVNGIREVRVFQHPALAVLLLDRCRGMSACILHPCLLYFGRQRLARHLAGNLYTKLSVHLHLFTIPGYARGFRR